MTKNERRLILGAALVGMFAVMFSVAIAAVLVMSTFGVISFSGDGNDVTVDVPVSLTAAAETLAEAADSGPESAEASSSQARSPILERIRRAASAAQAPRRNLPLPAPQLDLASGLTSLYEQVNPGVVSIVVTKQSPLSFQGQQIPQRGSGSGFVYDDRHIVTNNHVVGDADDVEIVFHDGQRRDATVVGTDVYSDLAVVRVDDMPDEARVLPVTGEFDSLKVGQPVVAIGNPFEKANSMSFGIISALGRTIPDGQTQFAIPETIQTDAAINPGNSGGPLLDLRGQVVGINAQINTTNIQPGGIPGNSGVGFAIPSSIVLKVIPKLIRDGEHDWSYLGVSGGAITTDLAEANGLSDTLGAYIHCVPDGGPSVGRLEGGTVGCGEGTSPRSWGHSLPQAGALGAEPLGKCPAHRRRIWRGLSQPGANSRLIAFHGAPFRDDALALSTTNTMAAAALAAAFCLPSAATCATSTTRPSAARASRSSMASASPARPKLRARITSTPALSRSCMAANRLRAALSGAASDPIIRKRTASGRHSRSGSSSVAASTPTRTPRSCRRSAAADSAMATARSASGTAWSASDTAWSTSRTARRSASESRPAPESGPTGSPLPDAERTRTIVARGA
jgi:S1-C subfamily serine protease